MKTYQDAEGRHYYIKEGEIHYVDDDEPDQSRPRRTPLIAVGIAIVLVVIGIGAAQLVAGAVNTRSSQADLDLFRTQVAIEQTQTAIAITPVQLIAPTLPPRTVTPTPVPFTGTESLTVDFANINPACTQHQYTGLVNLDVTGSGQAGGKDWSDAFYLYQHSDGTAYDRPQTEMFDLEIDGRRAIETLGLLNNPPAYNPDHHYQVIYNLGKVIKPICFRISDYNVGDNKGEFQITVSSS
jgi:hypothetical protein